MSSLTRPFIKIWLLAGRDQAAGWETSMGIYQILDKLTHPFHVT
jgi:hypothetical protein